MFPVVDPIQLAKIEGTHRGFLYQHLYAAFCLLDASNLRLKRLLVEFDEDVQFETEDGAWFYIQVKTRKAAELPPAAVSGIMERFSTLRRLHSTAARPGSPQFFVVANRPPSASLAGEISDWADDVSYIWPEGGSEGVPLPWLSVADAFAACEAAASRYNFSRLSPANIVWKVTSYIAYLSAGEGGGGHEVTPGELPGLLEQFFAQLHALPPLPERYRECNVTFSEDETVQLVEGLPGAGKSTWASMICHGFARRCVYIDASLAPLGGLGPTLARECLAAIFPSDGAIAGAVFCTGGLESLSIIDRRLGEGGGDIEHPLVIVDNAHIGQSWRILHQATEMTSNLDWLILGHPGEGMKTLADLSGRPMRHLKGWTLDSVAAELGLSSLKFSPSDAETVVAYTEGNPLFVKGLVALTKKSFGGRLAQALDSLVHGKHTMRVLQERFLGKIADGFQESSLQLMTILNISSTPISVAALTDSAICAGLARQNVMSAIRELNDWSVLESLSEGIRLRDAYRPIEKGRGALSPPLLERAASHIADWSHSKFTDSGRIEHLLLCIESLAVAGRVDDVVSMATADDEMFVELGLMGEVRRILVLAANDSRIGDKEAISALDTLAYWYLRDGDTANAEPYISRMAAIVNRKGGDSDSVARLACKQLLLHGALGDFASAETAAQKVLERRDIPEKWHAVVTYNLAVCARECGRAQTAEVLAARAVRAYESLTGISLRELFLVQPARIAERIVEDGIDPDTLKKLGDALVLVERLTASKGQMSGVLLGIQAHKIYVATKAYQSAVNTGQDVIDAFVAIGDIRSAQDLMKRSLIPIADEFCSVDVRLSLRSQHAVLMAYAGNYDEALSVLRAIQSSYGQALPKARLDELRSQSELVSQIIDGRVVLPPYHPVSDSGRDMLSAIFRGTDGLTPKRQGHSMGAQIFKKRSPSRNAHCPCGSGKKYKGCCGR